MIRHSISDTSAEVTESGGLVRVTHGSSAPEDTHVEHQAARVGGQSFAMSEGQLTERGVTRYSTHQQTTPGGSVLATMQRVNGQATVELVPGVPASRTTIDQAIREGLVQQNAQGFLMDSAALQAPGSAPTEGNEPTTEKPAGADQPFAYLDQEHAAEWQEMVEPLPQPAYDGTVAAAMASISSGDGDLERAVQRLTRESGMDPQEARELVETGEAMVTDNLARDLAATGLVTREEAPAFFVWCRSHQRLPEALSTLLLGGQTRVFRALAQEYAVKVQAGRA